MDTILTGLDRVFDETEQKCRNVVTGIPDGVYEAEAFLNDDGIDIGNPVRIHAKVTVAGSDMEIDLSGCSGERKAAVNSRTYAGARVAYKALRAHVLRDASDLETTEVGLELLRCVQESPDLPYWMKGD